MTTTTTNLMFIIILFHDFGVNDVSRRGCDAHGETTTEKWKEKIDVEENKTDTKVVAVEGVSDVDTMIKA